MDYGIEGLCTVDGHAIAPLANINDFDGNNEHRLNFLINNLSNTLECLKTELKEKGVFIDRLLCLLEQVIGNTHDSKSIDSNDTSSDSDDTDKINQWNSDDNFSDDFNPFSLDNVTVRRKNKILESISSEGN